MQITADISNLDKIIRRYPIEIFQKFRPHIVCKTDIVKTYGFDDDSNSQYLAPKLKSSHVLNNTEIRANLNFLINRKNISGQDEELYDQIISKLNKISDKNFAEMADEIMNLPYSKSKHIYRLAESILIKSIKEPAYADKYAKLSLTLLPCYIEVSDNKIYFRTVLLTICQDIFNELIFDEKHDLHIKKTHEYDRQLSYETLNLAGLSNFFGELARVNILPCQIISFCFDKFIKCIERGNASENKFDGLKNLINSSIKLIKEKENKLYNNIREKLQEIYNKKLFTDTRAEFILLDTIELFD
jgi:hypothetical protein